MSEIDTRRLTNGMELVVEPLEGVASVALEWLLPLGLATDGDDVDGCAAMLSELVFRGAGDLDSRAHSDALDTHGIQRTATVRTHHLRIGATMLGSRLDGALPLLTSMVTAPRFPDDAIEPVRSLCLQSLDSLEDDPQYLVGLLLREQFHEPPFNRHGYGRRDVLERIDGATIRAEWAARCAPGGAILSVAGRVDPGELADRLEALLADWTARPHHETAPSGDASGGYRFHEQDTAQAHIAFAWPAPRAADPDATLERVAIAVLSGSTSGRLFTEVRQKRSLCYSVGASYSPGLRYGLISGYAGTTPERAQETLDVSIDEVQRMREGVERDEFDRAVLGLKSRIVMSGESTPARAARVASEAFTRERPGTLREILAEIDAITLDDLNAYLASREIGPFTIVSIGPEPLRTPVPAATI